MKSGSLGGVADVCDSSAKPRVLLDLTTAWNWRGRRPVGIIRTEREIAVRLLRDRSLVVLPFLFRNGKLRALDHVFAEAMLSDRGTIDDLSEADPEITKPDEDGSYLTNAEHQPLIIPPMSDVIASAPVNKVLRLPRPLLARIIRPLASLLRFCIRGALRAVPRRARQDIALSLVHFRAAVRTMIYPLPAVGKKDTYPLGAQTLAAVSAPRAIHRSYLPNLPRAEMRSAITEPDLSLVIHPGPNDILFTCGLGWSDFEWSPIAALKAHRQLPVVCMVYDLIPILFPAWIPAGADLYLAHFLSLIDTADEVPCISRCTEQDLRAFARAQGRPLPSTRVVQLGADLPASPDPSSLDRNLSERLSRSKFAVAVGTFEVRKNYGLLLDVWDKLTADDPGFDLVLVIVGMRGWEADDVIKRLLASPLYTRRIFWLRKLGDGAVSWLYQRCHVALYPSLYEGWGLPVVEALQHRRPVIASNRGAVPEAGLGIAQIIDPDDLEAWCNAIATVAREPRKDTPLITPPTWDDAASSIRSILLACAVGRMDTAA